MSRVKLTDTEEKVRIALLSGAYTPRKLMKVLNLNNQGTASKYIREVCKKYGCECVTEFVVKEMTHASSR